MSCKNGILQKFKDVPEKLQLVCVGTTQAHYALDFENFQIYAFNMALYLNPIVFNYILLQKYKNIVQKAAIVLITLQYPIFCIDDFKNIAERNAIQYAKLFPGKNPYISKAKQLVYFLCPEYLGKHMTNFMIFEREGKRNYYVNHYKPWELESLCRGLIKDGWDKEIGIEDYVLKEHKKDSEKINQATKKNVWQTVKLVQYCQTNGWRPILLGLPYSGVLNQYVPDSFKRKCFYRNIDYIQRRTSCEFLDYSMDERMQDINNYMNVWFLNKKGRQKFTKIVMQDLDSSDQT